MEVRQVLFLSSSIEPCGSSYVAACLETAIISACGNIFATACVCAKSGQEAVASLAGPCLTAACPYTEVLAIADVATSACDQWLATHALTATTGSFGNATTTAAGPLSTTFSSATTSRPGDMNITSSPPTPTSMVNSMAISISTSTNSVISSSSLPPGAYVGIGVGALILVCAVIIFAFLCLRQRQRQRRKAENRTSPEPHELHTVANIAELPDKPKSIEEVHVVVTPDNELDGFEFPFQAQHVAPVEADSQSVRAQSRGRMFGTETTAFDFESQKVLITPGLRDQSRGSSLAAPSSPASLQRQNTDT